MNNEIEIPGYKVYETENVDEKPTRVSFLNITQSTKGDAIVTGVIKKHDLQALADLDRRERNYLRIDVTDQVDFLLRDTIPPPQRPYTIWTYTATKAAAERHQKMTGSCIIPESYLNIYEKAQQDINRMLENSDKTSFEVEGDFNPKALKRIDL